MHIIIITPSFNQLSYLKRCIASIADQVTLEAQRSARSSDHSPLPSGSGSTITVHHHIQDGGSTDGTGAFLKEMALEDGRQRTEDCLLASEDRGLGTEDGELRAGNDEKYNAQCLVPSAYSFSYESSPDKGMYDAINRGVELAIEGIRHEAKGTRAEISQQPLAISDQPKNPKGMRHKAQGSRRGSQPSAVSKELLANGKKLNADRLGSDSVVAWLNCDEQYLPGTLKKVVDYFEVHPETDILFGGMLMVDDKGKLLACRKAMPMRKLFLEASYLYNFSCSMFFRQSIWEKLGGFDTSYKNAGDEDLIRRAMKIGAKTAVLDEYLATFIYSDSNLSSDPAAVAEHERLKKSSSSFSRIFKLSINVIRLVEKMVRGGHIQRTPVEYQIYGGDGELRRRFVCESPSCKWPDQHTPYLMSHRLK